LRHYGADRRRLALDRLRRLFAQRQRGPRRAQCDGPARRRRAHRPQSPPASRVRPAPRPCRQRSVKRFGPLMHLKALCDRRSDSAHRLGELHRERRAPAGQRPRGDPRRGRGRAKFDAHFERMWNAGVPMIEFEPTVKALEPRLRTLPLAGNIRGRAR